MNALSFRVLQWIVWGFLGAVVAGVFFAFVWTRWIRPAPKMPIVGEAGPFALTNQFGRPFGSDNLKGSVWLADVIFTRCPGPCAKMTAQMLRIQSQLPADGCVQFVSLTADPEFDTPEVLKDYAARFGAAAANWHFLTGPKKELYEFAVNDLKFTVIDNESESPKSLEDRFLHSTQFVLVDQRGRIRGYFDGTDPSVTSQIVNAIRALLPNSSP